MSPTFSVSEFVAVFNQTIEYAYPKVVVVGELANFRISKNRWVYFDLKDEQSSVKFFGTIYNLPGPLEDGMLLQVTGTPKLHQSFGFSITVSYMQAAGEGSIKKAAALLEAKMTAEGLFALERKRPLPYPPNKIGLVTSGESAAYADFIKILNQRWSGLEIIHAETLVQGETAPAQIVNAINAINTISSIDVLVITRGGGSADDLQAFSSEQVVRAVANSRIPTLVAIGHEIDTSLAEKAADSSASTPSNAAELLVPDKHSVLSANNTDLKQMRIKSLQQIKDAYIVKDLAIENIRNSVQNIFLQNLNELKTLQQLLHGYDPRRILNRGYALVKYKGQTINSISQLKTGDELSLRLSDGSVDATINKVY